MASRVHSLRGASGLRFLLAACLCALIAGAAGAQPSRVPVEGLPAELVAPAGDLLAIEPEPASAFEARRQAERAAEVVTALLESEGYYEADVGIVAEGAEIISRRLVVKPGRRFTLATARVDWIDPPPEDAPRAQVDALAASLPIGGPARAEPILLAEDGMIAALRRAGYPAAAAEPVDALADGEAATMDIAFRLRAGARARLGEPAFTGLTRTRGGYLRDLKPWKSGATYSPVLVEEYRRRLADTGLFQSVGVTLGETSADGLTEVRVDAREGKRHTLALGASASTSEGFGLTGDWEKRNLRGRGEALAVGLTVATLERRIETAWRRPNAGRHGRDLELGLRLEDFETDAYDQTGARVSARIEEAFGKRIAAAIGVEAGFARTRDSKGVRDLWLASVPISAEYTGVSDPLDPASGIRARLAVEPGATWGDATIGYTRLLGEASAYWPIAPDRLTMALRGRLGSILGPSGAPNDKLFFAGGGGSVRGFEYQSLSPRDADGELAGGRSLADASAELRWRMTERIGLVGFVDAGAAGPGAEPPLDALRLGAGAGLRWYTAFGPLRVDLAMPVDRRPNEASFHVYLSIGQAF